MRTALVLGSASCVAEDVWRAKEVVRPDGVVACKEMIVRWPWSLDAAVSLHGEKMPAFLARRKANEYQEPLRTFVSTGTETMLPGQKSPGSSGLFAVKIALIDLGFDRVVCCGMPITPTGYVDGRPDWVSATLHRAGWIEAIEFLRPRVRSMSGWTAELLGSPNVEGHWIS